MMFLAPHHLEKVRDSIAEKPLEAAEMRRVEGLGEQYFALSEHEPGGEFTYIYTLEINGVAYKFYSKLSAAEGENQ